MCGIAGILNFGGRPVAPRDIAAMTDALAHRGRDSARTVIGGGETPELSAYPGIALGHRRLSIIDLSDSASQPMASADGRLTLVYNGELYNYRELRRELEQAGQVFRTQSDTEVVLLAYAAWGEQCLSRFNGMFAIALWDERARTLLCARDPIGIKPFYFKRDAKGFRFASESRALDDTGALDPSAVAAYFLSMYVPRRFSIVAGVEKLLPGHWLRVEPDGGIEIGRFWSMPHPTERKLPPEAAAAEMMALLDAAVARQLQSDVPVGALLSGGFDSGMIVASAARTGAPLHTYSVGFDAAEASELPIARSLAARYGTIHHERVISGPEVMALLDEAVGRMSEPVADSAVVPTFCLSEMAAADGVKVLLSGTGGDEVFAGYPRYVGATSRRRMLHALPRWMRTAIGSVLAPVSGFGARLRHPGLDMVMYTGGSARLAAHVLPGGEALAGFLTRMATAVYPQPAGVPLLYENMQFDLQVYVPDLLLMLLDQLTMAHTIEGRVPLLDTDLIAASFALPPELHAEPSGAETRKLMRRMARDRLDPRTFTARKQGFSGPVRSWIADNRAAFRERTITVRDIPGLGELPVEALWQPGADAHPAWSHEVFLIYCFAVWHDRHVRTSATRAT